MRHRFAMPSARWALATRFAAVGISMVLGAGFCASHASAATYSFPYTGAPVAIPDGRGDGISGGEVGAPIAVSGVSGTITGVSMSIDGTACSTDDGSTTVGLDHTFASDLQIQLESPDGTKVLVIANIGEGGNNFCQTVLQDGAATSIQSLVVSNAPFTGTYAPDNPLSAFVGKTANGNWTLLVDDLYAADTGSIRAWTVNITTAAAAVTVPTVPAPLLSPFSLLLLSLGTAGSGLLVSVRSRRAARGD